MVSEKRPLTAMDASGEPLEALDIEAEEDDPMSRKRQPPTALRWAALLSVPLLWGSFTPTMKLLLNVRRPPPALVTNLASHLVGALTLCIITLLHRPPPHCLGSTPQERRRTLRASVELGVYLFFGQLTQLLRLQSTSATVNAVLVQASVVIVPLCDSAEASSRKASRLAVVAARLLPSLLALGGVIVLTSAPSAEGAGASADDATVGVVPSLCSAVCYALHTTRLSEYADVDPSAQASGQVLVNALLDVAAMPVAAMLTSAHEGNWLASAPREALRHLAMAACWNGVFVVGATTWAISLSYAQQAFSASTAALAYAMEPLFAAVFAALILQESIHQLQLLGGGLVVCTYAYAYYVHAHTARRGLSDDEPLTAWVAAPASTLSLPLTAALL